MSELIFDRPEYSWWPVMLAKADLITSRAVPLKTAFAGTLFLLIVTGGGPALGAQDEAPPEPGISFSTPYDPLSPLNEKLLSFNVFFDDHIGRPVARAWSWVLPYPVRLHVRTFFLNTGEPQNIINCLLQRRFRDAGVSVERFSVNTTLGLVGFFDVADDWFGLRRTPTDFGLTAAHYSADFGPYLMAPVGGPTSVRDGLGSAADGPMNALSTIGWLLPTVISLPIGIGLGIIDGVNERSLDLDSFDSVNRYVVDLYGAVQGAYYQKRSQGQTASGQAE